MSRTVISTIYTFSFNLPNSIITKVVLMFSFIDEEMETQSHTANR